MRAALKTWLQNSGDQPLSLILDFFDTNRSRVVRAWINLSPILDQYITRCERLEMPTLLSIEVMDRFWLQVETARGLQELVLADGGYDFPQRWIQSAVRTMVRIRSFECTQYGPLAYSELSESVCSMGVTLACPYRGLRVLKLRSSMGSSALLILLSHFPALEVSEFTLQVDYDDGLELTSRSSPDGLYMQQLHDMSLLLDFRDRGLESYSVNDPFRHVLLPSLRRLRVDLTCSRDAQLRATDNVLYGLASSLSRSNACVEWVHLSWMALSDGVHALLASIPALKTLELLVFNYLRLGEMLRLLEWSDPNDANQSRGRGDATKSAVCPHLEAVKVILNSSCRDPDTVTEPFTKFIQSRSDTVHRVGDLDTLHSQFAVSSIDSVDTNGRERGPPHPRGPNERLKQLLVREYKSDRPLIQSLLEIADIKCLVEGGLTIESVAPEY